MIIFRLLHDNLLSYFQFERPPPPRVAWPAIMLLLLLVFIVIVIFRNGILYVCVDMFM